MNKLLLETFGWCYRKVSTSRQLQRFGCHLFLNKKIKSVIQRGILSLVQKVHIPKISKARFLTWSYHSHRKMILKCIFEILHYLLFITFLGVFLGLFASDKQAAKIIFWKSFILINVSLANNDFWALEFWFLYVEDTTWGLGGDWRCRYNYDWSCCVFWIQTLPVIMFWNECSEDTRSSIIFTPSTVSESRSPRPGLPDENGSGRRKYADHGRPINICQIPWTLTRKIKFTGFFVTKLQWHSAVTQNDTCHFQLELKWSILVFVLMM